MLEPEPVSQPGGLLPWPIRRTRAYVDEALNDRITLADAARQVRLSSSYFSGVWT